MDRTVEHAYKRACFQGRSVLARWLDRVFFSVLGALSLFILSREKILSGALLFVLLILFVLWDKKRWNIFKKRLWQCTAESMKREEWLQAEAERIRKEGGTVLYPTPNREELMGLCLRLGEGTAFHGFGAPQTNLIAQAAALGCSLAFHPWGKGAEPSRELVLERIRRDAPKGERLAWRRLIRLPASRYLLTGCLLLLLSICLRRALYWRLLGSLCLLIGGVRWSFQRIVET